MDKLPLTQKDVDNLSSSWITAEISQLAKLFRVDNLTGKEIVGRKDKKDYSGIVFPYYYPGDIHPRSYRLRRDNPEITYDVHGNRKEKNKYMSAPGDRNKLYFTPRMDKADFHDIDVPLVIVEGEKKALATYRLVNQFRRDWLVVGLSGAWNWKGIIGKEPSANGGTHQINGVISDFDLFTLLKRTVYLVFDSNAQTNDSINRANFELIKELSSRGANVISVKIPLEAKVNGIDDLLFIWNPEKVLALFENSRPITKPQISINRQLSQILPNAWEAIHQYNNPPILFKQFNKLVRIDDDTANKRTTTEFIDKDLANGLLFRCADWVTITENAIRPAKPPREIVADFVSNPDKDLPKLEAIVQSPVFLPSGELITHPGYYKQGKIYYGQSGYLDLPEVPSNPTDSQIDDALVLLNETIEGFPFTEQADRANTIATILEPFLKPMIPGLRPLRAIDAATPGTGKGLLASVIQAICFGSESKATPAPSDKAEWPKVITSLLIKSPQIVFFDNIRYAIDSPELELALTIPIWDARILSKSENAEVSTNVLWLCTGNNLRFNGELARRIVRIRLVADCEDPRKRTDFRFQGQELIDHITTNRPLLVHACLTLCQAWIVAGSPKGKATLGSFDGWAKTMSGVLDVLEIPGFLDNLEKVYLESDPHRSDWAGFVSLWAEQLGDIKYTVNELNDFCEKNQLLEDVRGDKTTKSQQIKLGNALRKHRDQVFANHKLIVSVGSDANGSGGRSFYHLVKIVPKTQRGLNVNF